MDRYPDLLDVRRRGATDAMRLHLPQCFDNQMRQPLEAVVLTALFAIPLRASRF